MRKSCDILIFIDIPKALSSGIKFFLSDNGVVPTEGNDKGFLEPKFFSVVQNKQREVVDEWQPQTESELPLNEKPTQATQLETNESNLTTMAEARTDIAMSTLVPDSSNVGTNGLEDKLGEVKIGK
jgi:2'-phosphotransferase